MEHSAPSSSLSSSRSSNHHDEKEIVPTSTSQSPIARSATRGMCNVYALLISSSLFCAFIRLALPRVFSRLSNSNHSNPSPSSSIVPATTDASRPPAGRPYDVFLNHRGPDVKDTLASLLYHFLESVGLRVFLDKEEFQVGDELEPTIQEAIRTASVHVAIFSKTYAGSPWCLDELCSMLNSRAIIIPVFYDVQPSDLRWIGKGQSAYDDAIANHQRKRRFDSQRIAMWKAALEEISYRHGLEFHGSTFNGLQSQLLRDLVGSHEHNIANVVEGKAILRRRLQSSAPRVLIILDDIDHENQVEHLLAKDVLGMGSLILITSRDEGAITRHSGAASVYKIKPLDRMYARELFCWHAFQQLHPKIGLEDLVEEFCEKCGRLPLFLKVMGAHLRSNGKYDRDTWKEELKYMPDEITDIMRISYNALSTEDKQIFLDVACFFVGKKKGMAIRVWNTSEGRAWTRLRNLENKCLVEVDDENRLKMHDHLRDFGREIANGNSPYRFWNSDQIISIREQPKGSRDVRGIIAASDKYDDCLTCNSCYENPFGEIKLSGLKLLAIKGNCFESRFGQLSTNLTWLRWYDCPHTTIPSWLLSIQKLTVLQLIGGRLKEWPVCDKQLLLKELKISETELSNLSIPTNVCPQLERLELSHNECLIEVGHLPRTLLVLRMKYCTRLERISGVFNLQQLKILVIDNCIHLKELPCLKHLSSLETLQIWNCRELQNIGGLEHLPKLQTLDIAECWELRELPNLSHLSSLEALYAWDCRKLKNIPGLEHLPKLQTLNIVECWELRELPNLSHLSSLETLYAWDCRKLKNIGGLEHLLKLLKLDIGGCWELRELANLSHLSSLETLYAWDCINLQNIPGLEHLLKLQHLGISGCCELCELPDLSDLISLETLEAGYCIKLQKIQGLEHLQKLQKLDFRGCSELREVPDLSDLSSLERFEVGGCSKLPNIPGLEHLRNLVKLDIRGCFELPAVPDLTDLRTLETFEAWDCIKLQNIQGLEHLQNLRELDIRGCSKLRELPNLSDLRSLERLEAGGCSNLQNIPGLEHLLKLQNLGISGCCELCELPDLSDLISLETLEAGDCIKLQKIQGLEHLQKLQKLDVRGCSELLEVPDLSDLSSLERLEVGGCSKLPNVPGLEHQRKLLYLDIAGCCGLHELPSLSDLNCLKTLQADGCWKLQDMHGLDQLEQLTLFKLSAAGYNRALLNSVQQFQKLPSTLFLSGIGDGSKDFSFLHVPVIELEFSAEDDWYQYWTSKIFELAEGTPYSAVMVCFVVHCSHVEGAAPEFRVKLRPPEKTGIHEILTVGDATPDLRSTMRTDWLSVIVGEGEWRCVGVFSQLMNSRSTTSSTYRMEVQFPKWRMHGLQVKQGWTATVSQGNEAQILEIIDKLFAP